jgi:hypothetical protein
VPRSDSRLSGLPGVCGNEREFFGAGGCRPLQITRHRVFHEHSMFARAAPLLLVVCLVLGPLWIATSGGADRSADYEAELARIDRAKPQPPLKPLSGEDLGNPTR